MKEFNSVITAHREASEQDIVIKVTGIQFMTPQEALDAGLGNLFDSRDNTNRKYAIAVALGPGRKVLKGALVDVDYDRFYTDAEYKFNTMKSISDIFIPLTNKE